MVTLKSCQDNNMLEEANRNWSQITERRYVFDKLAKQVLVPVLSERGGSGVALDVRV